MSGYGKAIEDAIRTLVVACLLIGASSGAIFTWLVMR